MVIISNDRGQSIELRSVGYEFENSPDLWDSNWTNVEIQVQDEANYWTTTNPFFSTSDWKEISAWFETISNSNSPKWLELGFLEPNIEFVLREQTLGKEHVEFLVRLSQECIPNFKAGVDQVEYQFKKTKGQCLDISKCFLEEYEKFPRR